MYSQNIEELLVQKGFVISSEMYFMICRESPQIDHVKYDAFSDRFQIWTTDGYYWNIKVHNGKGRE